ncbi:hypothetical protein T05_11744 [Trichinella murrelli]|uniref:Uncharacterized protein n=1 Tax=Trichinella murrelli TaxID=144512 RepID=A0A0V0U2A5_9BILA|nr:hypothetical protein T05_11744 [Trichinella murrelli]
MPTAPRMIIVKLTHDNIRDSANQCNEDKNIKTSLFRLQKQYSAQQKSNSLVEFDLQVIGSQADTYYWSKQLGISLARNS